MVDQTTYLHLILANILRFGDAKTSNSQMFRLPRDYTSSKMRFEHSLMEHTRYIKYHIIKSS